MNGWMNESSVGPGGLQLFRETSHVADLMTKRGQVCAEKLQLTGSIGTC